MNERIREIALHHFSAMPDEKELEDFAKHIARYCATICNTVSGDNVVNASLDYQEGREMGSIVCRNQILKHFGIEK